MRLMELGWEEGLGTCKKSGSLGMRLMEPQGGKKV